MGLENFDEIVTLIWGDILKENTHLREWISLVGLQMNEICVFFSCELAAFAIVIISYNKILLVTNLMINHVRLFKIH